MAKKHQLSDNENIMSQDGSQNTQVVFLEGKIGEVLPSYVESCSESNKGITACMLFAN